MADNFLCLETCYGTLTAPFLNIACARINLHLGSHLPSPVAWSSCIYLKQSFASWLKLTSSIFKTDANYKKVGNLGTVLHETSRLLADQFDVEPSAVIAVSLQFHLLSAKCFSGDQVWNSPDNRHNGSLFAGLWPDRHKQDGHHKLLPCQLETQVSL